MDWVQLPQISLALCAICDHHLLLGSKTKIHPHSHLHHNTYSPNYDERKNALDCISQAEDDIARLDSALGHISRIVESIKSHRDARYNDRDTCSALLSPIRRVPNEIWLKILPFAIQGTDRDFSLLQVCRHWNELLGSVPHAFNRVQLDLTKPRDVYTQFIQKYSTRLHGGSNVSRLDLVFPEPWKYSVLLQGSDASEEFIRSLTTELKHISLSSWWQSITHLKILNYSPNDWDQVFRTIPMFQPPPCLESLAIKMSLINHHRSPEISLDWDYLFAVFDNRCNNIHQMTIPDEGFRGGRLSVIHLTDTDAIQAKQILHWYSETLTCVTVQSARLGKWVDREHTVLLPRLHHLAIEATLYDIVDILRTLTCPSLVSLHLCGDMDWKIVDQFISRSGCSLEKLTLGPVSTSTDRDNLDLGLVDILRASPRIRRLTYFEPSHAIQHDNDYSGYHMSNLLLKALESPRLLPQLEHLITHCPSGQLRDVLAMADSRKLKHLGVHLLEFRDVKMQNIVEYYASDMTVDAFDTQVEKLRQQKIGVYRIFKMSWNPW
ncbi:hypothetical protein BDP27DRAFT_1339669 [Rhodocollybia butyracea]|uniref:F-box domain-containing protein n=1 Tax=Rhodocollybia butyracea TaxID=206335 RepID=A0A9P5PBS9_9AGAR|nr:hypothetical protein BDP27DRAFT_1339669 [Rhodocollybia butyracea]